MVVITMITAAVNRPDYSGKTTHNHTRNPVNPSSRRNILEYGICYREKVSLYTLWKHIRSAGIAPRILNSGSNWTWVVSFRLRPLYPPGKGPPGEWLGQRIRLDAFENRRISCLARNSITIPRLPGRCSVPIPTRTYLELKSFQLEIF